MTASARAYATAPPIPTPRQPVAAMPRISNQMTARIGPVNDPLEREADRVADQVTGKPAPEVSVTPAPVQVRRMCDACAEEERLQRKEAGSQTSPHEAPATVHETLRSPGQPLDDTTRAYFEPRFGHDFSGVRVHLGAAAEQSARDVNAWAYTVGPDIAFGAGRFAPATPQGRHLLAHELAHVMQQSGDSSGRKAMPDHGVARTDPILRRQPAPDAPETVPSPKGPGAPYRLELAKGLELANPLSDVEAHASTYELLPALIAQLSSRYNFDEQVGWRLFEWVAGGLVFMTEMTYGHEEGHGGEARRLGYDPEVTLNAPWSGETCPVPQTVGPGGKKICVAPPSWTADNDFAFTVAGVNQETINASRMVSRWALRKSISYQEAMAYLYAQTNLAAYALRTFALSITASKDDVYSYVTSQGGLSVGELLGLAAVADLLSGPAWAALLGQWNYLRHGERQVRIPTFKVGREMRATLPNFQVLLAKSGPLLGGRSTINVNGKFPVEVSIDASLGEPGIAVGGKLHAPLTPKLTLIPFGRFSYSQSEGAGGLAGLEAHYKLAPFVGISATMSYRKDDLLTAPEGAAEGWQGRAALTLSFD